MEFTEIGARTLVFAGVFIAIGWLAQVIARYLRSFAKRPPKSGGAPRT